MRIILIIMLSALLTSPALALPVTSVHDGDTFRLGRERVRILGMDAPEIGEGARCPAEQAAAKRARNYLKIMLGSPKATMERHGHDVYGRTLARVWVAGKDIAEDMISKDLAKPYLPRHHGDWC